MWISGTFPTINNLIIHVFETEDFGSLNKYWIKIIDEK